MNTINRIRFFNTNSRHVRCYGISQRLTVTDKNGEMQYYLCHTEELKSGKDDFLASKKVAKVVTELLQVNGIFWVLIRAFEINVKIENAFDWEDVNDEVIRIIKSNLFAKTEVDVQDRTEQKAAKSSK